MMMTMQTRPGIGRERGFGTEIVRTGGGKDSRDGVSGERETRSRESHPRCFPPRARCSTIRGDVSKFGWNRFRRIDLLRVRHQNEQREEQNIQHRGREKNSRKRGAEQDEERRRRRPLHPFENQGEEVERRKNIMKFQPKIGLVNIRALAKILAERFAEFVEASCSAARGRTR